MQDMAIYYFKWLPKLLEAVFGVPMLLGSIFLLFFSVQFEVKGTIPLLLLTCLLFWLGGSLTWRAARFFPDGIALELHPEEMRVSIPFGLKSIPRGEVRGCSSTHAMNDDPDKAGMVEIKVSEKYRVRSFYGKLVNPSINGSWVIDEDEKTLVKIIRDWRKRGRITGTPQTHF